MKKAAWVVLYSLWGLFLILAGVEKFGDVAAAGSGTWSVLALSVSGIFQLLAAIVALCWAVLGIGSLKEKYLPYRFINHYTVPVLIISLALIGSIARSSSDEARAQNLGFKNGSELAAARQNNITNSAEYAKFVNDKQLHEARIAAEKEQQARAEEAKCMDDALCYASKHESGNYVCQVAVEKSAKYQFKWTDGVLEPKFSSYNWYNKDKKLVTLYGNRAQAQNGFGAFKNIQYSCTFNANTGEVLNVSMQ
ncbi:hypothetical protein J5224_03270 [Candidatus Symbiopectobacterium sp. NZEC135]|nr:hypothetical protein [Candidatus Symbiopectobacterium sp. NZEC135]